MNKVLAFDLGGTAIKYGLIDFAGTILFTDQVPTPKESLEQFLDVLDSIVLPIKESIKGIAMSMPGRINHKTGHIYTGGAISRYMTDVPLKELLESRYQLPVAIENDGKCAAHAELWKGNLKDVNSGAVILIGFGIGGGIVLDGKVWRGVHDSAGEFSYLVTDYQHGSEDAAYWSYSNGIYGLLSPYAKQKNIPIDQINGKLFFEALHQKDEIALSIFHSYVQSLFSGILTLQGILDVDKYCIGGGISEQDILIESLRTAVNSYFDHAPEYVAMIRPQIDRCRFNNNANIIGALKNFLDLNG